MNRIERSATGVGSESVEGLSPTDRTTLRRGKARAAADRVALVDVLDAARVCHLGVVVDGSPRVVPTTYAYDLEGPDRGGTLYLHGSVAARSLHVDGELCVTITVLDALVLARSAFHHSMNYRSAMILGVPRMVDDAAERDHALVSIVDRLVPGRAGSLRKNTRKELTATSVVALPLWEASVKSRSGGPVDDPDDIERGGVWAGLVPLREAVGDAVAVPDLDVQGRVAGYHRVARSRALS